MTTFKNSKEYRQILAIAKNESILQEEAFFQCYADGFFDYKLDFDGKEFYFSFCIENDSLVSEQEIEWLLDLKTIKYFSFKFKDLEIVFNINQNLN